jgi:hypothetical protein
MKQDTLGYVIDIPKYYYDPFDENLTNKLSKYDEFNEDFGVDKSKTLKYIILMYDMQSDLRLEVRDFWERKRVAAMIAGFKFKPRLKEFDEQVEKMLLGDNAAVNNAITKYVMLFGSQQYAALVVYHTMLVFEVQKTLRGSYTKDTVKNVDHIRKEIDKITDELYGGKETINAKKALYSRIEKDRRAEKPEDIIKRINEGDSLSEFSPYGEDYEVDKMKFKGDK